VAVDRGKRALEHKLASKPTDRSRNLKLDSGSRVAVIGGGPAGSLFGYFLLDMAQRADLDVQVDIYEPRDFSRPGPASCNMCGGIVSESLVQTLAAEGINLPHTVVQRGIDSYVLHMEEGNVRIDTPLREKRIAAVHRGAGPRGIKEMKWRSFDGYLLELTTNKGAHLVSKRAESVGWDNGRPQVKARGGAPQTYDLLAVATGVNTATLRLFDRLGIDYKPPRTTRTYICEFCLGPERVARYLGSSMHVFLFNIPRLEFAALIPKGEYVTLCLLGREIDGPLVQSFLNAHEVKQCFPPDWSVPEDFCHCSPRINVRGAVQPFADRIVFIGDCGVTRLYKDGIGAAYRIAKAAARTAIFEGISAEDFRRHYRPACKAISTDNTIGRVVFGVTRLIQKVKYFRRGIFCMVSAEQQKQGGRRRMSMVLWDTFTGSAPYRDVFLRTLHPRFVAGLLWNTVAGIWSFTRCLRSEAGAVGTGALGKLYRNGEVIVRQGEVGDCMYVILAGQVEVVQEKENEPLRLAVLGEGEIFGEMALFERETRSATVRAMGEVRALTVDKRTFLQRVHEDPSLAFRVAQTMARRIRRMNEELTRARTGQ